MQLRALLRTSAAHGGLTPSLFSLYLYSVCTNTTFSSSPSKLLSYYRRPPSNSVDMSSTNTHTHAQIEKKRERGSISTQELSKSEREDGIDSKKEGKKEGKSSISFDGAKCLPFSTRRKEEDEDLSRRPNSSFLANGPDVSTVIIAFYTHTIRQTSRIFFSWKRGNRENKSWAFFWVDQDEFIWEFALVTKHQKLLLMLCVWNAITNTDGRNK